MAELDAENCEFDKEVETCARTLADIGITDLSQPRDLVNKYNPKLALLKQKIAESEREKAVRELEELKRAMSTVSQKQLDAKKPIDKPADIEVKQEPPLAQRTHSTHSNRSAKSGTSVKSIRSEKIMQRDHQQDDGMHAPLDTLSQSGIDDSKRMLDVKIIEKGQSQKADDSCCNIF